jgi:hypothetical protein
LTLRQDGLPETPTDVSGVSREESALDRQPSQSLRAPDRKSNGISRRESGTIGKHQTLSSKRRSAHWIKVPLSQGFGLFSTLSVLGSGKGFGQSLHLLYLAWQGSFA